MSSASQVPQSLQQALNTLDLIGLILMAGAFAVGVASLAIARSRGYLGFGYSGTKRILAALLGIFAFGAINVIVALVIGG